MVTPAAIFIPRQPPSVIRAFPNGGNNDTKYGVLASREKYVTET